MEEDYENNIGFLIHDVARLMRNLFDKRIRAYIFKKNLYLRAGFNFQRREDLKLNSSFNMSGFSFGLGFSIKKKTGY